MIHDVAMQGLPVVFLLDRSGVGGEDGKTHHGLFDFAATLPVPGVQVLAPCDTRELKRMLRWTLRRNGPVVIRYARGGEDVPEYMDQAFVPGKWQRLREGKDTSLLCVGTMVRHGIAAAALLAKKGIQAAVYNCSSVKELDREALSRIQGVPFFTLEEHMAVCGFGSYLREKCAEGGLEGPRAIFGVPDQFLQHGSHGRLMADAGLTPEQMAERILSLVKEADHGK